MCGRFFREEVSWEAYHAAVNLVPPLNVDAPEATYNAAPMSVQPVIRWTRERSHIELAPCFWGLVPSWWTKPIQERKFSGINADAETAHERPVYRGAFKYWRCLVPVSGFYVWVGEGRRKQPFAVRLKNREWFCIAGLWDTALIDGSVLESFTILTTPPNDMMAGLSVRMPMIVEHRKYQRWLNPMSGDATDMFEPFPAADMQAWPIGPDVGNVRNNNPGLIEEA